MLATREDSSADREADLDPRDSEVPTSKEVEPLKLILLLCHVAYPPTTNAITVAETLH